jgi:hypothetical protein
VITHTGIVRIDCTYRPVNGAICAGRCLVVALAVSPTLSDNGSATEEHDSAHEQDESD